MQKFNNDYDCDEFERSDHDDDTIAQENGEFYCFEKNQVDIFSDQTTKPKSLGKFDFMGFHYVSKGVKWAQKFGWDNYFHCSQKKELQRCCKYPFFENECCLCHQSNP